MENKISEESAIKINNYIKEKINWEKKYFSFVRWIATASLAFLPFFVSIIPKRPLNNWLLYLYLIVVTSITFGIISSCGLLWGQLSGDRNILNQVFKRIGKPSEEKVSYEIMEATRPKLYFISKPVFALSYSIFIISFYLFCILRAF